MSVGLDTQFSLTNFPLSQSEFLLIFMGKFGAQKKRSLKGKKNLSALAKDAMQVDQNQNKSEEGSNDQLNEGLCFLNI